MPELIITDFVTLPALPCPQKNLVAGDRRCASVAAASIVAKVVRDRIMVEVDRRFPVYGFARHKGYATPEHLAALDLYGPCPIHRRTFAGVWRQGELFVLWSFQPPLSHRGQNALEILLVLVGHALSQALHGGLRTQPLGGGPLGSRVFLEAPLAVENSEEGVGGHEIGVPREQLSEGRDRFIT